jgi:hypothetical protein
VSNAIIALAIAAQVLWAFVVLTERSFDMAAVAVMSAPALTSVLAVAAASFSAAALPVALAGRGPSIAAFFGGCVALVLGYVFACQSWAAAGAPDGR